MGVRDTIAAGADRLTGALAAGSDRLIAAAAPGVALQRAESRARLSIANSFSPLQGNPQPGVGYGRHAASRSKEALVAWQTRPGNADEDIVKHLDGPSGLRARNRDLFMGTPLARGAISRMSTNVVGAGLTASPMIDAEFLGMDDDAADAWELDVQRRFLAWASSRDCDAARRLTFGEQQALAFISPLMSGDVFTVFRFVDRQRTVGNLALQIVEADRVSDPWPPKPDVDIVAGIENGKLGEMEAVWFAPCHPGANDLDSFRAIYEGKWTRVPAFGEKTGRPNVLHVMATERPEQRRGVPALAGVTEALKQIGRYTQSELDAAVITAMMTVFVTSTTPGKTLGKMADGDAGTGIPAADPPPADVSADDWGPIEIGSGNAVALQPGESIEIVDPKRPNGAFGPFVEAMAVHIGAALEIPAEILLLHFTASYTAARAAFVEAWKAFMVRRSRFSTQWCQPVYEEWIALEVAAGRIAAPGFFQDVLIQRAWSGAEWDGPAQGQINERVEVEAAYKRVKYEFSTMDHETAALTGRSWHSVNRARRRELAKQREAGTSGPYESAQPQPAAAEGA